jgi:hypothetical protein
MPCVSWFARRVSRSRHCRSRTRHRRHHRGIHPDRPRPHSPAALCRVDLLSFAAALAILTGVGFGVFPSLRACTRADFAGLREGSRGGAGGRKERLRSALVMAEVAGSVVLLVSAGLLVRELWRIQAVDPGFRSNGVLTLQTALPLPKYAKAARANQFYSLGAALSYIAGRTMSALLAGVNPSDAPTFLSVVALCFGMTLAGCILPEVRAIRFDPTLVIRAE